MRELGDHIMGAFFVGLALVNLMLTGCGGAGDWNGVDDSNVIDGGCYDYPTDDYYAFGEKDACLGDTASAETAKWANDDCGGDATCVQCLVTAYNSGMESASCN